MGAGLTVVPHGQGGVEMGGFDLPTAIKGGVEGAEAENLGFGAAGGGAAGVRMALAQDRVAIRPQLARGFGAAEEDFGWGLRPVKGAAKFAAQGGEPVRG